MGEAREIRGAEGQTPSKSRRIRSCSSSAPATCPPAASTGPPSYPPLPRSAAPLPSPYLPIRRLCLARPYGCRCCCFSPRCFRCLCCCCWCRCFCCCCCYRRCSKLLRFLAQGEFFCPFSTPQWLLRGISLAGSTQPRKTSATTTTINNTTGTNTNKNSRGKNGCVRCLRSPSDDSRTTGSKEPPPKVRASTEAARASSSDVTLADKRTSNQEDGVEQTYADNGRFCLLCEWYVRMRDVRQASRNDAIRSICLGQQPAGVCVRWVVGVGNIPVRSTNTGGGRESKGGERVRVTQIRRPVLQIALCFVLSSSFPCFCDQTSRPPCSPSVFLPEEASSYKRRTELLNTEPGSTPAAHYTTRDAHLRQH